ncbi:CHASE domain-containing protein [Halopseudomonas sp.]|jgi:PAS domain S-box-containing protein|uniref:CHASE domain-containing protein n=1 Tax=Halopseudomonas sp. TaxID=2901191 RepID=UPI0039E270D8
MTSKTAHRPDDTEPTSGNFAAAAFTWRSIPAWCVLAAGLILTLLLSLSLEEQRERSANLQFDLHVEELQRDIEKRLLDHEQILLGAAGLFDVQGLVTRAQWKKYVDRLSLAERYPGIQGVGFSQAIPPSAVQKHITDIRAHGFPEYTIRPDGVRDFYTAIVYLEPFSGRNLSAFGFDMYSEPVRRAAMQLAVNADRTALSGRVELVQETHGEPQPGVLMYLPVYYQDMPTSTQEERWKALQGFVYSPYRMYDLMLGVLGNRELALNFTLHDGESATGDTVLYNSASGEQRAEEGTASHQTTRTIDAFGRNWTLSLQSRPAFQKQFESPIDMLIPLLGIAISLLLFILTLFVLGRRDQALALADHMVVRRIESDEQFRQLFINMKQGVLIQEAGGGVINANPAATQILGHSLEQMKEANFLQQEWKTIHEDLSVFVIDEHPAAQAEREGRPVTDVVMGVWHPVLNEWRWIRMDAYPQLSDSNIIIYQVFSDITEQLSADTTIKEARTFLSNVLAAASEVSIIATDSDGVITAFNKGAERMLGYSEAEMVGKRKPTALHLDSEILTRSQALSIELGRPVEGFRVFLEKPEAEGSETREWTYVHKDGSQIPVSLVVTTMRDDTGAITGSLSIAQDITERKRVDQMKSEFVSTVSHELRTPLTSISGALGLLMGGAFGTLPEKGQKMIATAHRNSRRLAHLINDLLDIEKIEAGKLNFDLQIRPLVPLIEKAIEANETYGIERQVTVTFESTASSPQVQIDSQRLNQVMANLISNAIKFSPDKGTVSVSMKTSTDKVIVSVADNGPGIPDAFRSRIFQKFSQADSSDSRTQEGTGLGLAISRELIERMGGSIGFESALGEGARFFFELPLHHAGPQYSDTDSATTSRETRILVVEDEPDVARLLHIMLTQAGYQVDIAMSGHDAIEALRHKTYQLMSLDLIMPGMSGLEVIRKVRAQPETANLPIIVVSAKLDGSHLAINGEVINIEWLAKPIDQYQLIDLVQRNLSVNQGNLPRVLHVEDDIDLYHVIREMTGNHFTLQAATTLKEARERIIAERFEAVILDLSLPDGSGWDLLPFIRARLPEARVIILSGNDTASHSTDGVEAVLLKSRVSAQDLLEAISSRIEVFRSRSN